MGTFRDRTGERHGRLRVTGLNSRTTMRATGVVRRFWDCVCDCGAELVVLGDNLSGNTQSCGCLQREQTSAAKTTHNGCGTPEYSTWCNIRNRCSNKNMPAYKDYGARGITVCARWCESFENFLADMGKRPEGDYSIERVDVNGNYEKSNCIWLLRCEQGKNTRRTHKITHEGRTMGLSDWSKETGISSQTIARRLRDGWSPSDAITKSLRIITTL